MQSAVRVGASWVAASVALLAGGVPTVGAAPKPITGKLSKPGYTVIAVGAHGRAATVVARQGSFRLTPRTERVSLHLRAPDGVYAGPIVIRGERSRAVLGVRAGARLGAIAVQAGYARLARRLRRRWVDTTRTARARHSVPIGARVFGRVRSKPSRRVVPEDRDRDGIPDPLDIDDDGDRILDNLDRSPRARAAQAPNQFNFENNLAAEMNQTVNANAASSSVAQMDALLATRGTFTLDPPPGDSVELDCGSPQSRTDPLLGGLSYCTRGGTGRLVSIRSDVAQQGGTPFPDCCDADGDGFGTLTGRDSGLLRHGATTAQIGTGDVLIARVTNGGVETQYPATLQYVPATVPALISYDDGRGNSATVTYPVPGPDPATGVCPPPGPPCAGPGTRPNPYPVKSGPGGDVVLTLRLWRPQRRPIPPETGEWIDIGRLIYEVDGGDQGHDCPQGAFSNADANLTPAPFNDETGGLLDQTPDRPASAANTIAYKVNLTRCLASEAWKAGEAKPFAVRGTDRSGYAAQIVFFKRQ